jgi:para-aminobenzoate synthetase component 1
LEHIAQIQNHIREGDFYEMNHCIAFSAQAAIDPYQTFAALNEKSPAPFACFVKDVDQYLLCASPERYMSLRNGHLISQPIKGTRKRQKTGALAQVQLDTQEAVSLKHSEKDRAENIMIVDLVRNDLSRVCEPGSVKVPELCEVYTYSHVHQMISTVSGKPELGVGLKEVVHATFPMGSMTGAPKIAVMQHTEQLENFCRGLYSGSVGYVMQGTMDMNVVIRSLLYDASQKRLSYAVGGAITIDSNATEEYQECLDKAATVLSIFG